MTVYRYVQKMTKEGKRGVNTAKTLLDEGYDIGAIFSALDMSHYVVRFKTQTAGPIRIHVSDYPIVEITAWEEAYAKPETLPFVVRDSLTGQYRVEEPPAGVSS